MNANARPRKLYIALRSFLAQKCYNFTVSSSANASLLIFAYSESKLTCHFVVVVLVLVAKKVQKIGKRSKKVVF